jgi:hypothetical protein
MSAIEGQALRTEGNRPVLWSGLQAGFIERTPGEMRAASQAPNRALKLLNPFDLTQGKSVPSLLQAHPSIDTAL